MTQEGKAALPRTPEEALQIVKQVSVPSAVFVGWMNVVATLPAGYAADLFVSMRQQLAEAVEQATQAT